MAYFTSNAPQTTDKQAFEALQAGWLAYDTVYDKIFSTIDGDRKNYLFELITGGAGMEQTAEGGLFPQATIQEVGSKTITPVIYKKSVLLSELGMATADPEVLMRAQEQGLKAAVKLDEIGASVFQNFLISTNGYGVTINGTATPLVGATQTVGATGTTQSNKATADLAEASLDAAVEALMIQRDHDGQLAVSAFTGYTLIVAPGNYNTAKRLVESTASTTSEKNSGVVNTHSNIKVICYPQMANNNGLCFDTNNDTVAELNDNWFLIGNRIKNPYKFIFTVRPNFEVRSPIYTDTGSTEYRISFAADAKAVDYVGTYGSDSTS